MKVLLLLCSLVVSQAFADSKFVDSASLYDCGGRVELRESKDNLHLKFEDVRYCDTLTVQTDWGTTLETYSFKKGGERAPYSPSYTLSNDMWRALGTGNLVLKVRGGWWTQDRVILRANPWDKPGQPGNPGQCGGHSKHFTGWGLTNTCKCAYYVNGQFQRHANPREEYKCKN